VRFTGPIWHWRGPSPYHFVTVPADLSSDIAAVAREVTYGWGMVPVRVTLGATTWQTSLWPRDGGYVVPIKDDVRRAEDVGTDDAVTIDLDIVAAPR
jgi:hypothetical protein